MKDRDVKRIAMWQMTSSAIILVGSLILAGGIFTASMFVTYAAAQLSGANAGYLEQALDEMTFKSAIMIFGSIPMIGGGIVIPIWRVSKIKETHEK